MVFQTFSIFLSVHATVGLVIVIHLSIFGDISDCIEQSTRILIEREVSASNSHTHHRTIACDKQLRTDAISEPTIESLN